MLNSNGIFLETTDIELAKAIKRKILLPYFYLQNIEDTMKSKHCVNCNQTTGHKRHIGIGTLLMVLITAGLWLFAIPFYQVRCIRCGNATGNINRFQ